MPNFATLAQLRTRVRQAADMVTGQLGNPQYCSDSEIDGYINDSYSELHDILVMQFASYFRPIRQFALVNGQETYALPDDFYKVSTVWLVSGTDRQLLTEYMERELPSTRDLATWRGVPLLQFRIFTNELHFIPVPTTGTIELWYTPQYKKLYSDTDTISISVINGWEEYIVVDAAIKCKERAGQDSSNLERRRQRLERRITTAASTRDAGTPQRVTDAYANKPRPF